MSYVAEEDPVLRRDCASARVSLALSPRAVCARATGFSISADHRESRRLERLGGGGAGGKGVPSFRDSAFNRV